jgi:hypothetical protein
MDEQNNRNLLKQAILDGISQKYEEELSATQEFLLYSKRLERKRRRMKRILLVMVVVIMASAALAASLAYFAGSVRGTVVQVTEDGRAVLDIMPQKLLEELSVGDTALVKIGSFKAEMPLAEMPSVPTMSWITPSALPRTSPLCIMFPRSITMSPRCIPSRPASREIPHSREIPSSREISREMSNRGSPEKKLPRIETRTRTSDRAA